MAILVHEVEVPRVELVLHMVLGVAPEVVLVVVPEVVDEL